MNPWAAIRDLRLRIPPSHIAQRLPHLHADSVASRNSLALQLNTHSTTCEQILGHLAALVTSTHYHVKRFSLFKVCAVEKEDNGPKWWEKMLGQI
ncbi:hypothetical protein J5N97_015401 [Dioscorea zingiberensis]|uniref:Uncharacterized protein n=1 Tax=Dioscorea zingiberensis TaxID=325984 RepID=A0A9D5CVU2_9LILI|nr:hypothetical protein J5N97_015401 [Dioscorea zingiberensis]